MADNNSGSLRRNSGSLRPVVPLPEINLFDELNVFAELSESERDRLIAEAAQNCTAAAAVEPVDEDRGSDFGFEVVEMSKTRPLVLRPSMVEKQPEPAISVCPNCGAELSAGDLFCECGAFLDETAASVVDETPVELRCDDCGSTTGPDEMFCPGCGSVLQAN
jgi:hypothetical protein